MLNWLFIVLQSRVLPYSDLNLRRITFIIQHQSYAQTTKLSYQWKHFHWVCSLTNIWWLFVYIQEYPSQYSPPSVHTDDSDDESSDLELSVANKDTFVLEVCIISYFSQYHLKEIWSTCISLYILLWDRTLSNAPIVSLGMNLYHHCLNWGPYVRLTFVSN